MATYPYALTIPNASFQSGTADWTTRVGGGLGTYGSGGNDGGAFVRAGSSSRNESDQYIDLPSDVLADVDAGLLNILLSLWQSGFSGDSDSGSGSIEFFSGTGGSGDRLGMAATGFYDGPNAPAWAERTRNMWVPPGSRSIRLALRGKRLSGTNNDAYFDSFSLTLTQRARPHKQIAYLTGWEVDTFTATLGSSATFFGGDYRGAWYRGPGGGTGYEFRDNSAAWRGYKDYAIPAGANTDIDAGNGSMEITFNTGSFDNQDPTQVYVEALDASNASLGTIYDSGLADGSTDNDTPFRGTAALPVGTRTLRLWNYKRLDTGASADGSFNRLSLQVEADGVLVPDPEPSGRRRHAAMMIG